MNLRVLVAAVMAAALAGCGGGGGEPSSLPTPGVDRAKLGEAVKCMRDNGFPDFPDPIQDQGYWVIPPPASDLTPPPVCLELFKGAKGPGIQSERTPADIAKLRQWAECMRTNGLPTLPDPDSNGDLHLPADLTPITANPSFDAAREACKSLEPPNFNPTKV